MGKDTVDLFSNCLNAVVKAFTEKDKELLETLDSAITYIYSKRAAKKKAKELEAELESPDKE